MPRHYNKKRGAHTQQKTEQWKVKSPCNREIDEPSASVSVSANSGVDVITESLGGVLKVADKSAMATGGYHARAQIRATFYPKFDNEKSDQEMRTRMIELVSNGVATLEVSLKHSGSLFMYAGNEGGAYAKNSFGNIYTAVGVFVLGKMLRKSWGTRATKKQAEFNEFLERNRICISMELVTAVLGDHGQRPKEDYVVVTAVTQLGSGKPKFLSTPEIIAFCREWRLPTNQIWLFSSRKSVTSFFAAFDALCEEGTATPVCKALDEVADIRVTGSKEHTETQGEILEGLVARIVSPESAKHMEQVLRDHPCPPVDEVGGELDMGPTLRDICAANRSNEIQQMKALLKEVGSSFCPNYVDWLGNEAGDVRSRTVDKSVVTDFLHSHPADYSTRKLQEIIRVMREKRLPAAFKCYNNFHKVDDDDNMHYKMVIHVHRDSAFRQYQKEMRRNPGLWPLYRGFFFDVKLFRSTGGTSEKGKSKSDAFNNVDGTHDGVGANSLADEDANLMVKLKFLTYKLRTFLIRNGLSILFKDGPAAYRTYYLRQMKIWGTSAAKQNELKKMLDEWAVYIIRKCGHKQLRSDLYLSEAEPFLEQYAKRSPANQALIGSAGNMVRSEDFLAVVGDMDEEGDLQTQRESEYSASPTTKEAVEKAEGFILFFPGIPGCAKSALCRELLNTTGGFGDGRPIQSLMGDLTKGRYWQKVADCCRRKPNSVMLADKNAPNEEVWRQIEDMCGATRYSAVPIVPESSGTDTNPYSLDALAVFMFRVLQRVNHPGNLDKNSPNAGFVLLMFYHLYEGKSRSDFEAELIERFGSLVKMPLLKPERAPLPDSLKSILEEGINLYKLHSNHHGRLESTKGSYAKDWAKWEKQLRDTLLSSAEYLKSIQVPFESAVSSVLEELQVIAKGEYTIPSAGRRRLGTILYAGVSLPVIEIQNLISDLGRKQSTVGAFLADKDLAGTISRAHITLAHKKAHGVVAVANFGQFLNREVPVQMTALLLSEKVAAFEVKLGDVDGEKIYSKNEWPHSTIWTAKGIAAKEANTLPQLVSQGQAECIAIDPPVTITGKVEFF